MKTVNKTTKRTSPRFYTKEEVKMLITMWEKSTKEEIKETLNFNDNQVNYLQGQIKKYGYKLTPKRQKGNAGGMIKEVLKELKLIK